MTLTQRHRTTGRAAIALAVLAFAQPGPAIFPKAHAATVIPDAPRSAPSETIALRAGPPSTTETIVMLRHGEKPRAGLGQLSCQGLNRALALPAMLAHAFARPDAIYAPNPGERKSDSGADFNYIRPLATIEPTAIALGMPVDSSIGFSQLDRLQQALEAPVRRGATVLVAWEHHALVTLAGTLLVAHGGNSGTVPDWPSDDFDRIYVIRLHWSGDRATATFEQRAEGLDGRSKACPSP
jgi:hypothetical protein